MPKDDDDDESKNPYSIRLRESRIDDWDKFIEDSGTIENRSQLIRAGVALYISEHEEDKSEVSEQPLITDYATEQQALKIIDRLDRLEEEVELVKLQTRPEKEPTELKQDLMINLPSGEPGVEPGRLIRDLDATDYDIPGEDWEGVVREMLYQLSEDEPVVVRNEAGSDEEGNTEFYYHIKE